LAGEKQSADADSGNYVGKFSLLNRSDSGDDDDDDEDDDDDYDDDDKVGLIVVLLWSDTRLSVVSDVQSQTLFLYFHLWKYKSSCHQLQILVN